MEQKNKLPANLREQINKYGIQPYDLVFYLNSNCNLRCKHCYIGNDLLSKSISFETKDIINFINSFDQINRLTLLGGEPFLHSGFDQIVNSLAFERIRKFRVTTNLTEIDKLQYISDLAKSKLILSVSLDGHNSSAHDLIRGRGSFNRTLENLKIIIKDGFEVEITHTLMTTNINEFNHFISLCKNIGVKKLNIHRMSLHGNALIHKTLQVSPTDYVLFCNQLRSKNNSSGILKIRFPRLFTNRRTYKSLVKTERYRPHASQSYHGSGQRIVIYPTRQVFISSEFFGTESHIGNFDESNFYFNESHKNELVYFKFDDDPTIDGLNPNQNGDYRYPIVLSVSYKESIFL